MAVATMGGGGEFIASVFAEFGRTLGAGFMRMEADHAFVPAILSSELRTTEGAATGRIQMAHDDAVGGAEAQVAFKFANFRVVEESYRSCIRGTTLDGESGRCGRGGCRWSCRSVRPHVQEDMFVIGGALVSRRRPVLSIHEVFAGVAEFLAKLVHHLFFFKGLFCFVNIIIIISHYNHCNLLPTLAIFISIFSSSPNST